MTSDLSSLSMRRLVLFDIDGTILWTAGAGRSAIRAALVAEMGTAGPIDGFRFDGKTDPQIVRELLTAAGHPQAESDARVAAVCATYLDLLGEALAERGESVEVFPGVMELLAQIEQREGAVLGLLTGNLERGAALKLEAAGIAPARFRVGAYGSDAAHRPELPLIAVRRAAALMGWEATGEEVVIVGDTPADMTCGNDIGARAIGVATGHYRTEELLAAGAQAAFESLESTDAVIAAIYE